MSDTAIYYLTGHLELTPVKYWIGEQAHHRRWWFDRTDYFIESEFVRLGPFKTRTEAELMLRRVA